MILQVVMAHRGVEDTCLRHLPVWKLHGDPIFFCPADSIVQLDDHPIWTYGRAGHHSKDANQRFLAMLHFCAGTDASRFVVQEYDSICFGPLLDTPEDAVSGIAYTDISPTRGFVGQHFIHPPLFFSRPILLRLIEILSDQKENEWFFWDRWLGLACERGGIPIHDLHEGGRGYSQNTINSSHLAEAVEAAKNGATCFHGVKSKQVFDALKAAGQW